ncbi:glycine-rich domain-containing protein 2-like [Chenopodium quinoa]|uniref:glycine-rich domain-containing protein 2-like n=1 Tax=Chenopodium quinoa TaxID=63459 RepID=UPI000B77C32A|nr:glycine-rich domain-containing protein 2-like [Chenopodium quinoa]
MPRYVDKSPYEVIGVLESREDSILAKKKEVGWSLMDSQWDFRPRNKPGNSYELLGETKVIFFPGKKLEYATKHSSKRDEQDNFTTAVEFSPENPYGKAVALFDLKFGVLQVEEEWFLLPGTISAYCILYDAMTQEEYRDRSVNSAKYGSGGGSCGGATGGSGCGGCEGEGGDGGKEDCGGASIEGGDGEEGDCGGASVEGGDGGGGDSGGGSCGGASCGGGCGGCGG